MVTKEGEKGRAPFTSLIKAEFMFHFEKAAFFLVLNILNDFVFSNQHIKQ